MEANELRFFDASYNNAGVLEHPILITNKIDCDSVVTVLSETDPFSYAHLNRSDTKWQLVYPATTCFYITYRRTQLGV